MVTCCGKDRDTVFCPECGTRLTERHTLAGLLRHIRHHIRVLRKEESRWQGFVDRGAEGNHLLRCQRKVIAASALIAKWEGWANDLELLMLSK